MVRQIEELVERFKYAGFPTAAQRLSNLAIELDEDSSIPEEIDTVFKHRNFTYDSDRSTVSVKGREKRLTLTENAVLRLLTKHVGGTVTFADFAKGAFQVNGADLTSVKKETKTYMVYLRRKLDEPVGVKEKESCIRTVRGEGYMLSDK